MVVGVSVWLLMFVVSLLLLLGSVFVVSKTSCWELRVSRYSSVVGSSRTFM